MREWGGEDEERRCGEEGISGEVERWSGGAEE